MSGGSYSPKLSILGDAVKLVPVDSVAIFQISAIGFHRDDVQVNILSELIKLNINPVLYLIMICIFNKI
jgi:hypothetical protein